MPYTREQLAAIPQREVTPLLIRTHGFEGFAHFPFRLVLTTCSTYSEAEARMKESGYDPSGIFLHTLVTDRATNTFIEDTFTRVILED